MLQELLHACLPADRAATLDAALALVEARIGVQTFARALGALFG